MGDFHRPSLPGAPAIEVMLGHREPDHAEAGHRVAQVLVRGQNRDDADLVDRVVRLVDHEGLGTIADLWAGAPADTVAGCLWRLYLIHTWAHRNPAIAAREYDAGLAHAPVQNVLAGVSAPPTPDDIIALVDAVMRGVVQSDFDVVLDRAAAFTHVVAVGRSQLESGDPHSAARLFDLARALRHAATLERAGRLA